MIERTPTDRTYAWLSLGAAAIVGLLAALTIQPNVAGLFHDDGVYLSVARSLAEGDGYRLGHLPGAPLQTKYPFLLSGLLAVIWRVFPEFPANLVVLKAVGVVSLVAIVLLAALWYRRRTGRSDSWQIVFAILVGMGPLVLPLVDYTLTDLPFFALCLAALCLADSGADAEPGRARPPLGRRTAIALGVICGSAFLLRQAGAPLVLACLAVLLVRREWRNALWFLGVGALFAGPWLLFKWTAGVTATNPLLSYYTAYEPSVPELALREGPAALGIVLTNLYYVGESLDSALFLPIAPSLRIVVYPLVALGLVRGLARPWGLLHWFTGGYLLLIIFWPFHPGRYVLPILPLAPLGLVLGTRTVFEWVRGRVGSRPARVALRAASVTPLAAVCLMGVGWYVAYLDLSSGSLRLWFAEDARYAWAGFEETIDWVRTNTEPEATLATGYDPLYYLYTDRKAVRPWLHRPWTHFYPPDDPAPELGRVPDIHGWMEGLDIRYMIIDPLTGYAVEEAAGELFRDLLARYTPPEFEGRPVLRFVSSDSLHRVYELPRRAGTSETDPGGGS